MKRQFAAGILLALLSGVDLVSAARIAYDCLGGQKESISTESVPSSLKGVHVILFEGSQSPAVVIWKAEDAALIRTQKFIP